MLTFRIHGALSLCLLLAAAPVAHAAELVTLHSGFSVRCTSREQISAQTVRLHLGTTANGDGNYMDVPADAIASVEAAPDEPTGPVTPAHSAQQREDTGKILAASGASHNINVALLASVVQAESAGNPRAVSRAGARGLMQLMPGTAAELHVRDSMEPADNVNGGSAYLDTLLKRYHDDLPLALAAYNAGPGAVDRFHGIPPYRETRLYVARVIREFNRRVLAAQQQSKMGVTAR